MTVGEIVRLEIRKDWYVQYMGILLYVYDSVVSSKPPEELVLYIGYREETVLRGNESPLRLFSALTRMIIEREKDVYDTGALPTSTPTPSPTV